MFTNRSHCSPVRVSYANSLMTLRFRVWGLGFCWIKHTLSQYAEWDSSSQACARSLALLLCPSLPSALCALPSALCPRLLPCPALPCPALKKNADGMSFSLNPKRNGFGWLGRFIRRGVGKKDKALYRQAFAARRDSTMHSAQPCRKTLSPKRYSTANPKPSTP